MKKQRRRIYAALLCSSMVLSLVSTPVSAAETGQMLNPQTSTEGPGSPESASGNEAAAALNILYAALPMLSCRRIRKAGYTSSDRATPFGKLSESTTAPWLKSFP